MIAYQGISCNALKDFDFVGNHRLRPYDNNKEPVVVFGGPRYRNAREVIQHHHGVVIVYWMGADAHKAHRYKELLTRRNIINVVCIKNTRDVVVNHGIPCYLIRKVNYKLPNPLKRGNKIYSYIHNRNPLKYGGDIVDKINTPYKKLIADLKIPKGQWYAGKCDELYEQSFIGLALSGYAGGGTSIIEMGLRGIRVVTNVRDMPHTIPWKTKEDIERAILTEAKNIGTKDEGLSQSVYQSMYSGKGFDLNKLIIE